MEEEEKKETNKENDSINLGSIFFVIAIIIGLIILFSFVIKPALIHDNRASSTFFQDTQGEGYWEGVVR